MPRHKCRLPVALMPLRWGMESPGIAPNSSIGHGREKRNYAIDPRAGGLRDILYSPQFWEHQRVVRCIMTSQAFRPTRESLATGIHHVSLGVRLSLKLYPIDFGEPFSGSSVLHLSCGKEHPSMIDNVAEMEVVASGSLKQIENWSKLLRGSTIVCEVRRFCDEHKVRRADRAELWVTRSVVDLARKVIREALGADSSLLW